MAEELKYGHIHGGKASKPLPMAVSEVVKAQSGRFVSIDANGRGIIAAAGEVVFGFVEAPEETTSATAGATIYNAIFDPSAIFRIPVDSGTYIQTMLLQSFDLAITSDIQGADLAASSDDYLILVYGDLDDNNYVDCMFNPDKRGIDGVV